jgi:hypothetical protein
MSGQYSPPTLHAAPIIAVPGASPVHGPGPVQCDDSSEDDEEAGIYKVKFGADDTGNLGIKFREVSIESVKPEGMGQYRARRTLEPGFILKAINGVPADRLAYNACVHHHASVGLCTLPCAHARSLSNPLGSSWVSACRTLRSLLAARFVLRRHPVVRGYQNLRAGRRVRRGHPGAHAQLPLPREAGYVPTSSLVCSSLLWGGGAAALRWRTRTHDCWPAPRQAGASKASTTGLERLRAGRAASKIRSALQSSRRTSKLCARSWTSRAKKPRRCDD